MTSAPIARMILDMFSRVIGILLILGWVSLSVFDLLEDLDEVPGQPTVSSSPHDDGSSSKRGGWGPLANNIVESATRIQQADVGLAIFASNLFAFETVFDFRRHLSLHKLYRVFLI